ncbi:proto-oncogene DBL-like isoform X4 [Entelurus aequoreus]|uniref:proto-oncogene DBL-like isoform X4 n=1 Tax=Entelurus aequoreus TaxID=161455 RepID=UPI002B1DA189|nr:proto-oncogene DBL-like isoform X4 [Entelurus aequoreus]
MAEWGFPRLRRAATSFPGNLHLVLVLRPSTLLGSAPSPSSSTDLGFRFSQDDFLLKMPAVMLRSVGDLLRYIDDNRLTSGLCGTAERCRSDWIVLRSAIETFAVTVKEVAQLLQGFGSELSDGELPDEANAIDFLLRSHTQRYRHMKSDIRGVLKEGRLLLDNLETLKVSKRTVEDQKEEEEEDVQADMDTVQRLLAQLRDMEEAFDGFFDKHHLKMQQYHQLILYESSFQQMEEELEKISAEEKAILSVGSTLMHTEQLLKDLNTLDQRAQEGMARAQVLLLHGHQLAANHHYALALIIQRCNELRHHCDVITSGVRSKRASLTRTRDLLLRLDEALRWCDEGAYLLASQMVDKFQTREGAQEALHYLSCHQERAPPVIKNKQDFPSLEFEAILTPQLQDQISMVMDKLTSVQAMMRNREQCLRKMADVRVRPVQLVAPRPEAEQTLQRCKSPLFTPKHGVDFNLLNSKFSFDLLPGKRTSRRSGGQRKIEVMHDYHGNRSTLYGSAPDTDSEAEDNPEQITRRVMKELIYTEKIYVDELLAVLLSPIVHPCLLAGILVSYLASLCPILTPCPLSCILVSHPASLCSILHLFLLSFLLVPYLTSLFPFLPPCVLSYLLISFPVSLSSILQPCLPSCILVFYLTPLSPFLPPCPLSYLLIPFPASLCAILHPYLLSCLLVLYLTSLSPFLPPCVLSYIFFSFPASLSPILPPYSLSGLLVCYLTSLSPFLSPCPLSYILISFPASSCSILHIFLLSCLLIPYLTSLFPFLPPCPLSCFLIPIPASLSPILHLFLLSCLLIPYLTSFSPFLPPYSLSYLLIPLPASLSPILHLFLLSCLLIPYLTSLFPFLPPCPLSYIFFSFPASLFPILPPYSLSCLLVPYLTSFCPFLPPYSLSYVLLSFPASLSPIFTSLSPILPPCLLPYVLVSCLLVPHLTSLSPILPPCLLPYVLVSCLLVPHLTSSSPILPPCPLPHVLVSHPASLSPVVKGYRAEMEDPSMAYLLPSLLLSQKDILFGNMPEIYQFHSRIFLQDLQRCLDTPERVGGCFLLRKDKFQVYERYCQNKPRSESLWRQCSDSAFFQECQKKLDHKLALDSYLLKPVQRLTKYQLLLKELLKHCTQLQYRTQLQEALDCMLDLLKSLNDSMHQTAITGYQVDHGQKCCSSRLVHKGETFMISLLLPVYYSIHFHTVRRYESDDAMFQGDLGGLGRVLLQGGFSVWVSHKRAAVLARFKPMQRHVFLYERALLFCKRRDERTPVYSFKSCLRMDSVRVTESVKGDGKKFEMCDTAGHEVYVLQAPSVEVKDTWLSELHKIISQQQKGQVAGVSEPLFSDSSSATSHAHRWEEFVHTSPAHSDPVVHSPRRGWPVAAHSVAICDGLEDWGATDLSDSEDEDDLPAPLVPGRYRVLVASSMASSDDIIFNCGDVIQLMHEDVSGMWLVRNVSRGEEGRVLPEDLHRILGETC